MIHVMSITCLPDSSDQGLGVWITLAWPWAVNT